MERARRFDDLRVYQEARDVVRFVYANTKSGPITRDHSICDQMRRAAVSILSNIAQGFERQSNAEFTRFLFGELRAQGTVAFDQAYWSKEVSDELAARCRKLGAGLANLIKYLQAATFRQRKKPVEGRAPLTP